MYRRLLTVRPKLRLVRLSSDSKRISDLFQHQSVKEYDPSSGDMLDDLSTFGSVLSPKKGEEELDPNAELAKLIEDISSTRTVTRQRTSTSVHDSELFNKLFETIASHGEARSTKTSDFLSAEIKRMDNVNLSMLTRNIARPVRELYPEQYKESQVKKMKIVNFLKPAFNYIDTLETSSEVVNYVKEHVIARFVKELEKGYEDTKSLDQAIEASQSYSSQHPPLNKYTLPVLIEYCIRTLVRNYTSPQEAISLFHSLKETPSVYLRACNVDLYNTLLKITWEHNANIEDTKSLLKDMLLNGFPGDLKTVKVLSEIQLDAMNKLIASDKDMFINRLEKYRYHYRVDIERRIKFLNKHLQKN